MDKTDDTFMVKLSDMGMNSRLLNYTIAFDFQMNGTSANSDLFRLYTGGVDFYGI